MMKYGERLIERKIEGNKVINVLEFKQFEEDYEEIAVYLNDNWSDEPEELYSVGVYLDWDDFHGIDCDLALDKIKELIEEEKKEEGEDANLTELNIFVERLKRAKGFTIYFNKQPMHYKNEVFVN